ncbi:hypothetical protein [Gimesia algae]|nr:hypothetical protein [Gimesia algae]
MNRYRRDAGRYQGGAGVMGNEVRRPAGIHYEPVWMRAVKIWKNRAVFQ